MANKKQLKASMISKSLSLTGYLSVIGLLGVPLVSFASTSDTTGADLVSQIKTYLSGNLGLLAVLASFSYGVIHASRTHSIGPLLAGIGLAMGIHFGPGILTSIFGAVI